MNIRTRVALIVLAGLAVGAAAFVAYVEGVFNLSRGSVGGVFDMSSATEKRTGAVVDQHTPLPPGRERATLGGGCFWCTEAFFQQLKGVESVVSGYSGGHVADPTYRQVCSGSTGHAEVIQVTFDPKLISYADLLEVFWQTHDATTLNRQGNDLGTQYRSAIYYHNDEQQQMAEDYKQQLGEAGTFAGPIVTEIVPFTIFYPAEDYHQNYFAERGEQPYCAFNIKPKVEKFRKASKDKLRS